MHAFPFSVEPNANKFSEMQFNQLRKKKCQKVRIIHKIAYSVDKRTRAHTHNHDHNHSHIFTNQKLQSLLFLRFPVYAKIFSYKEFILAASTMLPVNMMKYANRTE